MLPRFDVIGRNKVVRQPVFGVHGVRAGLRIHQDAVGEQLVGEHVHLFLGFAARADDIARIFVRKRRLDAVAGVVGKRQRNRAGGRDRAVVREAAAPLRDAFRKLGVELLHVARVTRQQHPSGHFVADLVAVAAHLRATDKHGLGDGELVRHDRRRALFGGQIDTDLPANLGHFARHALGEFKRLGRAVFHPEKRERGAEAEEAHAMAALVMDFMPLLFERQAVDFDHVVEHAREYRHHFAVLFPIEAHSLSKRLFHEFGQIHGPEQARAVRRQRLLAAGVGGADVLAEPVVVHLVNAVDEDKSGLGIVVGRGHDQVPEPARRDGLVHPARHLADIVGDVALGGRPVAPDDFVVRVLVFVLVGRERQVPRAILFYRLHELVGDEAGKIELTQAPVLALGADEIRDVRVRDVERAHLRAATTAGGRHREAHGVEDIHKREGTGGMRSGPAHKRPFGAEGRELVTDAAAGLERQAGLVHRAQDAVHRVRHDARHRAVDGRGRRLVRQRAGVGRHAARGDGAVVECPEEFFKPFLALLGHGLDVRERARHASVGVLDGLVEGLAALGLETVLLVPDVVRRRLQGNLNSLRLQCLKFYCLHVLSSVLLNS